jgi:hypothetical protein
MNPSTAPTPRPAAAPARSRLAEVKRGKLKEPPRILIYGEGGLGKSTFAAGAPNPIFLSADAGAGELDVARYPFDDGGRLKPESYAELKEALADIEHGQHDYQTLVLDVMSEIEPLVWAETIRRDTSPKKPRTIEEVGGGFMKGYTAAVDDWRPILAAVERIWSKRQMIVILIDHCTVRKFKNAAGADYGRFSPKIHEYATGLFYGWVTECLFVQLDTVLVPVEQNKREVKVFGQSTGARVVHTVSAAEWYAKNRHDLPETLPLDWPAFADAVAAHQPADPAQLKAAIEQQLAAVSDAKLLVAVRASLTKAGDDAAVLAKIHNKLTALAAGKAEVSHAA